MEKKEPEMPDHVLEWSEAQFITGGAIAASLRQEAQNCIKRSDAYKDEMDERNGHILKKEEAPGKPAVFARQPKADHHKLMPTSGMLQTRESNRMTAIYLETLANRVLLNSHTEENPFSTKQDTNPPLTPEGFHKAMMETIIEFAAVKPEGRKDMEPRSSAMTRYLAAHRAMDAAIDAIVDAGAINERGAQGLYHEQLKARMFAEPEPEQTAGDKVKKYLKGKLPDVKGALGIGR